MKYICGLLLVCLLNSAYMASACWSDEKSCCDGKEGSTSAPTEFPENESPADGPSSNSNAAVCYYYRSSKCLFCTKGSASKSCCTKTPTGTDETQENGPTPLNEFLIGHRYTHADHNIDWHKLYPKKNDNSGYWGYTQNNEDGRKAMGLHPGYNSLGCVTVDSSDDPGCWDGLEVILSSGEMTYGSGSDNGYDGFLYVLDK